MAGMRLELGTDFTLGFFCLLFFETAGLQLSILLSPFPECWDYSRMPLCSPLISSFNERVEIPGLFLLCI
jgi:hypothetical protein